MREEIEEARKGKKAEPTTATIQENTGREILKSNGSMTVSKRGNIGRRKKAQAAAALSAP